MVTSQAAGLLLGSVELGQSDCSATTLDRSVFAPDSEGLDGQPGVGRLAQSEGCGGDSGEG